MTSALVPDAKEERMVMSSEEGRGTESQLKPNVLKIRVPNIDRMLEGHCAVKWTVIA